MISQQFYLQISDTGRVYTFHVIDNVYRARRTQRAFSTTDAVAGCSVTIIGAPQQ